MSVRVWGTPCLLCHPEAWRGWNECTRGRTMLVTSAPIRGCRLTIDPAGWVYHVAEAGLHGEITTIFIFNIIVIGSVQSKLPETYKG